MNESTIKALQADPAAFRAALRLDNGQPWVLDAWQDEFFRATDGGWQRAIGRTVSGGFSRAWSVRPRGHSKTFDIAVMVAWALLAAARERPVRGVVAAGDEDQARLVADAVKRLIRVNAWLAGYIDVQRGRIVNTHTASECSILSSDAPTSMGLLVDFIVADELTSWPERGRDLWDSLFSAAAKQPHTFLAVLGNAGYLESWQCDLWQLLQTDPAWHCHSLPGPVASWISPAALAEQQRVLAAPTYQRLWLNIWTRGRGDAISLTDLEAAVTMSGPMTGDEPGVYFGGGIDLGTRRDHSAVVVLGVKPGSGRVRLAWSASWKPCGPNNEVPLMSVESGIRMAKSRFNCGFLIDPSQADLMRQRLACSGILLIEKRFNPATNNVMGSMLVQAFKDRVIDLYRDEDLLRDLSRLNIQDRPFGVRLDAPRDAVHGHCDRGMALSLCLPAALEVAMSMPFAPPPPQQISGGHEPTWGMPVGNLPGAVDSAVPNWRDEFGPRRRSA